MATWRAGSVSEPHSGLIYQPGSSRRPPLLRRGTRRGDPEGAEESSLVSPGTWAGLTGIEAGPHGIPRCSGDGASLLGDWEVTPHVEEFETDSWLTVRGFRKPSRNCRETHRAVKLWTCKLQNQINTYSLHSVVILYITLCTVLYFILDLPKTNIPRFSCDYACCTIQFHLIITVLYFQIILSFVVNTIQYNNVLNK